MSGVCDLCPIAVWPSSCVGASKLAPTLVAMPFRKSRRAILYFIGLKLFIIGWNEWRLLARQGVYVELGGIDK
jgi:hypothetical protein